MRAFTLAATNFRPRAHRPDRLDLPSHPARVRKPVIHAERLRAPRDDRTGVEAMGRRAARVGRWTDRVEDVGAWVLLAAGLLVIIFAFAQGVGLHRQLVEQGQADALDRAPAVATLLEATPPIGSDYPTSAPVSARATWLDRSGVSHTGTVDAPEGLEAGRVVRIWVDQSGAAVPEPMSEGEALATAVITAVVIVLAGASLLGTLWGLLKWATLTCNCARWEREWREVAPAWSRGEGTRG